METTNISYKLIKKIKDEHFEVDQLHQYVLLLNLGVRDLQLCVVDDESKRCLLLEDYVFDVISSYEELQELLFSLFEAHHLLTAGFWKEVRVAFKNSKFIQVPDALFIPEAASEYLSFNARLDTDKEEILYAHGKGTDAVTVFAVPKIISNWLRQQYANTKINFIHQSNALIEFGLQYDASALKSPVYIYIDRFKLHIMVAKSGKLIYYNQFAIKQFPDYVNTSCW
ncbi:MAG TPA: DUF3822 family protein [Cyclobacteriaceae bacterium]|nr:DUF3822 family protein [Cyclobacteriaceae bacterium]